MGIGLAIDVGTSGIRIQAIDLEKNKIISTAITLRHPIPGSNIIDHLHFTLENGCETSHRLVVKTIDKLIKVLEIDEKEISRVAACGNPIQMSIFQGIECRDLAFAGDSKLRRLGIQRIVRNATIVKAAEIGLNEVPSEADVCIPPSIEHAVGGDAIAMIVKSNLLEQKTEAVVADFGTNAEMSIKVGDTIYTGSAAAGPAIEGQQIEMGALASPRTISDMEFDNSHATSYVLDNNMFAKKSYTVDLTNGNLVEALPDFIEPKALTGTGTVALISEGLKKGLIKPPNILTPDKKMHVYKNICFNEKDLQEAGHAFGAFRAGYITLVREAGTDFKNIKQAYMCGASGFYVDAIKANALWLTPTSVEKIFQVGNTSLAMAADVVRDTSWLDYMQKIALDLRKSHIMFANSEAFSQAYTLELAFWDEGMPIERYLDWLKKFNLPVIQERSSVPEVTKLVIRDIPDLGYKGLKIYNEPSAKLVGSFEECSGCKKCEDACLEGALIVTDEVGEYKITIRGDLCDGVSCKKCELACPTRNFDYKKLKFVEA